MLSYFRYPFCFLKLPDSNFSGVFQDILGISITPGISIESLPWVSGSDCDRLMHSKSD